MAYKIYALATLSLLSASHAYALVDTEVSVGQRTQKFLYDTPTETGKSKAATGSEITASLMFSPLLVIPVSFGLTVQSSSIDRSKVDETAFKDNLDTDGYYDVTTKGTSSMMLYGPMIKVWAPTPFVKPYLKFAYLMGAGTDKIDINATSNATAPFTSTVSTKGSQKFSHSGTDLDIGLGFSPAKLFTLFFEYAIHSGTSKTTDQTIDSVLVLDDSTTTSSESKDSLTDDQKKAQKANATAIRMGISIGF